VSCYRSSSRIRSTSSWSRSMDTRVARFMVAAMITAGVHGHRASLLRHPSVSTL
jgi:hypothetical protein